MTVPAWIADQIDRMAKCGGPAALMREDELSAGRRVINPDDEPWYPSALWADNGCVSQDGKEIRIIAVTARYPGQGSFRKMLQLIGDCGLTPVVVEPINPFLRDALRRWGWTPEIVGVGRGREEQWRRKRAPR